MIRYESKVIICPSCLRKVGTYDGRSTINFAARCPRCNKRVIYNIKTGMTELKPLAERTTGSGMTFY